MREAVVCIHGVWMSGLDMWLLQRRLQAHGFEVYRFRYPSLTDTPAQNATRLHQFIQGLSVEVVHLVAHSLGGIVTLHLFERHPLQPPGRVVMLGTPISGSSVARQVMQHAALRWALGRSVEQGLLGNVPRWQGHRELGMVAGAKPIGIGALIHTQLPRPHDGTVAVSETQASELNAHLIVPYSHLGMLNAPAVAHATAHFLKHGQFGPLP